MPSSWVKFRDKASSILGIGAKIVMAIAPFAGLIPGIPAGILKVFSLIPALMSVVEEAMPESGSGPARKTAVLNSTKMLMEHLEVQLTGGAKGSFDKLRPAIEALIEGTVGMVNGLAPQIIADDKPELSPGEQAP